MITERLVKRKNNKDFYIYYHSLSDSDLDEYILSMFYEKNNLNNLFDPNNPLITAKDRLRQLRKFIPTEFKKKEIEVYANYMNYSYIIDEAMQTHKAYYSFYAEALMAVLNKITIDANLITGVINFNSSLIDQHTGPDVCMYSNKNLILGEAKFYLNLHQAIKEIIKDFTNSALKNKLDDYYSALINLDYLIIKPISNEDLVTINFEEFSNLNITLTGFVLHNKENDAIYQSCYDLLEEDFVVNLLPNCTIKFYHLPIKSKKEFIYKIIKKALELIVNEQKNS